MLWRVAQNEAKTLKLLDRVVAQFECVPTEFRCYPDEDIPGCVVYFETAAVGYTWADVICSMLSLEQRTAKLSTVLPHMVARPLEDAVKSSATKALYRVSAAFSGTSPTPSTRGPSSLSAYLPGRFPPESARPS